MNLNSSSDEPLIMRIVKGDHRLGKLRYGTDAMYYRQTFIGFILYLPQAVVDRPGTQRWIYSDATT